MLENRHQTEEEILKRVLSALQEIMNEATGEMIPFTADTLYSEYWELPKYSEYIDHLDFCFRIEAHLGVDMLSGDGDRLFGKSIQDADEWQERIGSKLTFRHIAEFVRDRTPVIAIEPAFILSKPCQPAGAFRAIAGVVSELLPSKEAFPPSAKIDETFTSRDLRRIWFKLNWLSENRLPPLRTLSLSSSLDRISLVIHGVGLFFAFMGSAVGLMIWAKALSSAEATFPTWPLLAIGVLIFLVASCIRQNTWARAPKHIQTIADLARAMVAEPDSGAGNRFVTTRG